VSSTTGIFFYYQQGERLKDFPQALEGILEKEDALLFDAFYPYKPPSPFDISPVPLEKILKVHSHEMVQRIKASGDYEGALYSSAGTLAAAIRVWTGEIRNAFVFTGYGDHHAGSNFYGGGCYFNGAAIAIRELRESFNAGSFAIIDTDAHHGNGTWELFEEDRKVLYICFCSGPSLEKNLNVNVHVPFRVRDDFYLDLVKNTLKSWIPSIRPEIIFWNWGYDGTIGEYGDIGLSPNIHIQLAREIKRIATEICQGRLIVILCGGGQRSLAHFLIPRIINILMDESNL
jgi:acetoin utilization deacetylase AcuC-like enzyme